MAQRRKGERQKAKGESEIVNNKLRLLRRRLLAMTVEIKQIPLLGGARGGLTKG
jgi:hypothetical protein